jgi:Flp pilus assembly protein TadD
MLLGACSAQTDVPGPDALNVADAAIASNQPQLALQVSQALLARDPDNSQALYHEAAAYYAVNRCEDTIAAYRVALKLDPKSSEAETGIGRCLLRRNAIEAEQAFEAAVSDDPNNAAALNDLGIARDLRGDFAGATQPYQQALLIDPGELSTEVNLGMSLALSHDPQDGLQYLGPLANTEQATPKIREDYALALLADGQQDRARQILEVDLTPETAQAALESYMALLAPPTTSMSPPALDDTAPPAAAATPQPAQATPAPPVPSSAAPPQPSIATGPSDVGTEFPLTTPTPVVPAPPPQITPPQPTQTQQAVTAPSNEILR